MNYRILLIGQWVLLTLNWKFNDSALAVGSLLLGFMGLAEILKPSYKTGKDSGGKI